MWCDRLQHQILQNKMSGRCRIATKQWCCLFASCLSLRYWHYDRTSCSNQFIARWAFVILFLCDWYCSFGEVKVVLWLTCSSQPNFGLLHMQSRRQEVEADEYSRNLCMFKIWSVPFWGEFRWYFNLKAKKREMDWFFWLHDWNWSQGCSYCSHDLKTFFVYENIHLHTVF